MLGSVFRPAKKVVLIGLNSDTQPLSQLQKAKKLKSQEAKGPDGRACHQVYTFLGTTIGGKEKEGAEQLILS